MMKNTEWKFPSSSSAGVEYTTRRNSDGSLSCNCRGWTFKRGDGERSCSHTRRVEAMTEAAPRPQAAPQPRGPARTIPAPMLASAMTEPVEGKAFDRAYEGWLMEEKHDGHRVGIVVERGAPGACKVLAWSRPRAGEEAKLRALPDTIVSAMAHLSPGIYDGELVVPGGNAWDVTTIGSRLVFVMFDVLELDGLELMRLAYEARRDRLLEELRKLPKGQSAVSTVESVPARWATIEKIWKRGGEGAILKRRESAYLPGLRASAWVKVKAKRAATLTVIGFEEGKMGPYSKLKLRDDEGVETTVKVLGNAMLREIATRPRAFVGRRVVITYQQRTPSGRYRHGIFDHYAGEGE